MQLTTIVVTRNKSASVKTLHTILKLNILCLENDVHNKIIFTNDDSKSRRSQLQKNLKGTDRLLWIDYGIYIDENSLRQVLMRDWKWHGIVLPCVTEGINWDTFRKNIGTPEPITQKGLGFDTVVTRKIQDDFFSIETTDPRCFCVDAKHFLKNVKKIQTDFKDLFIELGQTKFKAVAYTAARLIVTYPHECVGNILNAAGVTANKD